MDPQQWLRDYRARGEAMVQRSQQFREQLQANSGSCRPAADQ